MERKTKVMKFGVYQNDYSKEKVFFEEGNQQLEKKLEKVKKIPIQGVIEFKPQKITHSQQRNLILGVAGVRMRIESQLSDAEDKLFKFGIDYRKNFNITLEEDGPKTLPRKADIRGEIRIPSEISAKEIKQLVNENYVKFFESLNTNIRK